jgi:hypothetical protein
MDIAFSKISSRKEILGRLGGAALRIDVIADGGVLPR